MIVVFSDLIPSVVVMYVSACIMYNVLHITVIDVYILCGFRNQHYLDLDILWPTSNSFKILNMQIQYIFQLNPFTCIMVSYGHFSSSKISWNIVCFWNSACGINFFCGSFCDLISGTLFNPGGDQARTRTYCCWHLSTFILHLQY